MSAPYYDDLDGCPQARAQAYRWVDDAIEDLQRAIESIDSLTGICSHSQSSSSYPQVEQLRRQIVNAKDGLQRIRHPRN